MPTISTDTGNLIPTQSFPRVLDAFLGGCIDDGMQPPLIACVTCPDGSTQVIRYRPEAQWEILVDHSEGRGKDSLTVLNIMVVDQTGVAVHVSVTVDDRRH